MTTLRNRETHRDEGPLPRAKFDLSNEGTVGSASLTSHATPQLGAVEVQIERENIHGARTITACDVPATE